MIQAIYAANFVRLLGVSFKNYNYWNLKLHIFQSEQVGCNFIGTC